MSVTPEVTVTVILGLVKMEKLVVVFGATGNQGGSVIKSFAGSQQHRIRGVTRDIHSDKSRKLVEEGTEMVAANLDDYNSVLKVLKGASMIFAVTDYGQLLLRYGSVLAQEKEYQQAVNLARAAAATTTLEHYIWSTIPSASAITNGRIKVPHFESKASADDYIHTDLPGLAQKTTFLWIGYFASNIKAPPMAPTLHSASGKYVWLSPVRADTRITSIGLQTHNVGLFVNAIFARPQLTLPARYILAEVENTTIGDIMKMYGKITGVTTEVVDIGPAAFDKLFPGWDAVTKMFLFWQDAGRYSFSRTGVTPLTRVDLGVNERELTTTEEAFNVLDLLQH